MHLCRRRWLYVTLSMSLILKLTRRSDRTYFTRSICMQVYENIMQTMQKQYITILIVCFNDLESHLRNLVSKLATFLVTIHDSFTFTSFQIIISNLFSYVALRIDMMPSLHDDSDETINLRHWIHNEHVMWVDYNRLLDEVVELMWALFYLLRFDEYTSPPNLNLADVLLIARAYRRRIVLSNSLVDTADETRKRFDLSCKRKSLLFRRWVLMFRAT